MDNIYSCSCANIYACNKIVIIYVHNNLPHRLNMTSLMGEYEHESRWVKYKLFLLSFILLDMKVV